MPFLAANPASMGVKLERTYQNLADPDQEIAADDRVKAFRYGKTLVPFSKADESGTKRRRQHLLLLLLILAK